MNQYPRVPKGYKYPGLRKVKPNRGKQKPGGRHNTTTAQRSASRRNIHKALLTRQARGNLK